MLRQWPLRKFKHLAAYTCETKPNNTGLRRVDGTAYCLQRRMGSRNDGTAAASFAYGCAAAGVPSQVFRLQCPWPGNPGMVALLHGRAAAAALARRLRQPRGSADGVHPLLDMICGIHAARRLGSAQWRCCDAFYGARALHLDGRCFHHTAVRLEQRPVLHQHAVGAQQLGAPPAGCLAGGVLQVGRGC